MSEPIRGRVALVSGAGNGLGRAIALALAAEGAAVVVVGRRQEPLTAVAGEIADAGGTALVQVCDVSSPASVGAAADALAQQDVSILVNNAGIAGPVAPLTEVAPEDWDEVFAVNVRGTYLMCRAFLPAMVAARRGDVINLASVSGKRPLAGRTPYTASKMAILGLTATLAHEVGQCGVAVNSLSPGPVLGARMARNIRLEAARRSITEAAAAAEFTDRAALRRMVEESEVGDAVVAMLRMPGLTGADIDLSAGMVAR